MRLLITFETFEPNPHPNCVSGNQPWAHPRVLLYLHY
jgi:hypothetical protein